MGASYNVGLRSSGRVQSGLEAGASYINADTSEIGKTQMNCFWLKMQ